MNLRIEKILCAAIHYNDGEEREYQPKGISSGFIVCGYRHSDIIKMTSELYGRKTTTSDVPGFLTSFNRFVDRKEGAKIALESGQIDKELEYLTSEDLY